MREGRARRPHRRPRGSESKYAPNFELPGFDAQARAAECEQTAATVRRGSAEWKLDETQARLQDRRDRAFTLVDKAIDTIRGAAEFAFRNDQDDHRLLAYRDRYTMERQRRSRQKAAKAQ